nr:hypothetical protein [Tanacetum cinerariifolium]
MYALTKNSIIFVSLIEQFWQTATVRTVDNGEQEIIATVDGKEFTITKASVRRHLQLADADGISVLPNAEIFDQLSLMGDDLVMQWSLVKEGFSLTEPTNDKERTLLVELKRLFEPDTDDTLWKLHKYMHDPLTWRLYDTCEVHHVSIEKGMDIFMLVEKEYPLSKGVLTLMLVNKLLVEQHSEMTNEILRRIFIQFLHHSSANSWQWDLHSSGSGNTLHWQWKLILPVGTLS